MNDSTAALLGAARERLVLGLAFGLMAEGAWQLLTYAGLLEVPHGFMLVMFWCIYASNAYGARYGRVGALAPLLGVGLVFAALFAGAMRLVLLVNGIDRSGLVYGVFALSATLGALSSVVRWRRSRRR